MSMDNILATISSLFDENKDRLAIAGSLLALFGATKLILFIYSNVKAFLLAPVLRLGVDLKSQGSWAVVTGCTDGIGREYALQLAQKGLNVVLMSRSMDRLKKVATEIETVSRVKTRCIAVDFASGREIFNNIAAQLNDISDFAILVNNVGIVNECPDYFCNDSDDAVWNIVQLNCIPTTFMTKMILPKMVARKKGVIVNLGSCGGVRPYPYCAIYGATKAFVDSFTQALAYEYEPKGITVQVVHPGFVSTKLTRLERSLEVPTPEMFVRSAIPTIGVLSRTAGYWVHNIILWFLEVPIPDTIINFLLIKLSARVQRRQ